jgi:phosphatidylglycerol:prolipoprotein diacylglycerol transferase
MLSLSLIAGWYISLPLAEKDGLPKETMANCYVVTALCALAGSRVLYVLTNPDEFRSVGDLLALRNGGLVAYGGFIGGLLGSWAFLASRKIRLLAWADDAVPSLASGLLLTRIGCYLFGCDFGKRLSDGAPHWLKTLGRSPTGRPARWPSARAARLM